MQSRNFFTFGPEFNILTDSVFVSQFKIDSATIPPIATHLITQDNKFFITEDGNNLIAN